MSWDDSIRQTLEQIAKDLRCGVTQTNGGCVFNYLGKNYYFSYFMNSRPNDTFKMVYNKDYVPRKNIGKPNEVGNYKIVEADLEKMKREIVVKIVNN